jgi:hypothetical protein
MPGANPVMDTVEHPGRRTPLPYTHTAYHWMTEALLDAHCCVGHGTQTSSEQRAGALSW